MPSTPQGVADLHRREQARATATAAGVGARVGEGLQAAARPLFVSVGHRVGLATAVALVHMCCRCVGGVGPAHTTAAMPVF